MLHELRRGWPGLLAWIVLTAGAPLAVAQLPLTSTPPALRHGRELLAAREYRAAREVFTVYLKGHPASAPAELGLGEAQMGLHQYEAAELTLRGVVAQQPELWQAHKNLVVVEAALHRWEEFDREREVLAMARRRGAPGISARESDAIDSFDTAGGHWVVRAYFVPLGRSQARYNFERFSAAGKVEMYVSLEDAAAARAALTPGDVRVGGSGGTLPPTPGAGGAQRGPFALTWYTGSAHGTIRTYAGSEPGYQRLRADVLRWVRSRPKRASE